MSKMPGAKLLQLHPGIQDGETANVSPYINDENPTVEKLSEELRVPKVKIYRWIRDGLIQFK